MGGRQAKRELAEGDKAPDFSLPRDGGGNLSLADFRGQKLVLFFYPKADTPGCTTQSKDFSARQKALHGRRNRGRRRFG